MIKYLFQDIDECIIETEVIENDHPFAVYEKEGVTPEGNIVFRLPGNKQYNEVLYHSYIRPCAKRLFKFYNELLGKENVYILTTSVQDYARVINRLAGFGLDDDHIIPREVIRAHKSIEHDYTLHDLANSNNVLIDNLPPHHNLEKIKIMDIQSTHYFKAPNYFGDNLDDKEFEQHVKDFVLKIKDL